ncbi:uncharacterized protein LOC126599164 [Malus sylvestris]|uniref:uncharacterized protein LOC126599164 n=1 Tax=Malus sylvestris TaxID=3752 RepID=UPI0021AD3124|nr:uncharacterized protein LOC126599164 [Malus sylvestris]
MAGDGVDDLVVHLEKSMDLSTMEQGIKLVGTALVNKTLNKWGVRNILKSAWQRWGDIKIKWVKDHTFVIKVNDEITAAKIIDQVPWAVMKQNFSVKRWPLELALEEIDLHTISFWIQIRGVPPSLSSKANIRAGGLSLWWDDSIQVEITDSSKHLIDARCCIVESGVVFRFTGTYGTSYRAEKEVIWRVMIQNFRPDSIPWICGGDFNEFLWDHEKVGGAEVRYNRPRYLEEFMNKVEVLDLSFNGQKFTWRGTRNGQLVEAQLDRVLVNDRWLSTWPDSFVTNATTLGSDHCPILLHCEQKAVRKKKMFRFEAFWTKDADCKEIVRKAWEMSCDGNLLQKWNKKLHLCRTTLTSWSKVDLLWRQEECYWQQRSRVQWLREGDANTKFFHQSTLHRRRRNKVVSLKNSNGNWIENPNHVRCLFDEYFMELFTSSGHREWGNLLDCVSPKISDEMNVSLLAVVSSDEVRATVLQMGSLKAPGLDGFPGIFYQANWDIIATEVLKPESVAQFRPISLCNYSYKVFSKVLANRLKVVLSVLISPSQNAFVVERLVTGSGLGVQMSPSGPSISHILFADDTLIFLKAEEMNCRHLIQLIDKFCAASGQHVNKSKSSVCFGSNVPEEVSRHLAVILGFERVGDPGIYLGVPAMWGRSKKAGLAYVKGRLLDKMQGWKKSTLSQAGREILIKAVAQAIPAYLMNLFKFPISFCNEMDALISKFWWGQQQSENKIHWVSREKMGRPKEDGGLGFRSFVLFNDALLAKQCWRLIMEPNSLWALVLKARYFPNCSFLDAKKGGRASWVWSSLLTGREILREGAH